MNVLDAGGAVFIQGCLIVVVQAHRGTVLEKQYFPDWQHVSHLVTISQGSYCLSLKGGQDCMVYLCLVNCLTFAGAATILVSVL